MAQLDKEVSHRRQLLQQRDLCPGPLQGPLKVPPKASDLYEEGVQNPPDDTNDSGASRENGLFRQGNWDKTTYSWAEGPKGRDFWQVPR